MLGALLLTVAPLKPHPEEGATRNSYLRAEAGNVPKQMSNLRRLALYIVLSRRLLNFVLVIRTQMLLLLKTLFTHSLEFRIIIIFLKTEVCYIISI